MLLLVVIVVIVEVFEVLLLSLLRPYISIDYRYVQDIYNYELVEMLHIATLKVSVLFVCTMQIVQEYTDELLSLVSLSLVCKAVEGQGVQPFP